MKSLRSFNPHFILLAAALALTGLHCSGSAGDDGGTQPTVKFDVSASVPADGTTGPFDLYLPDPSVKKPHFTVQFTKLMDASMVTSAMVTVSGFDIPVTTVADAAMSHGNVLAFKVVKQGTNTPARFKVGAHYTVTVDKSIIDPDGNTLGKNFVFAFTPEPKFRVTRFSFANGDTAVPAKVELFTNSSVNALTVGSAGISPAVTEAWTVNPTTDSTSLTVNTYSSIKPGSTYTVSLATGAKDRDGNSLPAEQHASFITPAFSFTISQFPQGTDHVNLAMPITFTANYPLDIDAARAAFSLTPATAISLLAGEKAITFSATNDFQPSTDYTARISTGLKTISGYSLPSPVVLQFKTAAFGWTSVPAEGTTGVSRHDVITLNFTGALASAMTIGAVDSMITIRPSFDHRINFGADYPGKQNVVFIVPLAPLPPVTQYTVIVSNGISSVGGYTPASTDSFHFQTSF